MPYQESPGTNDHSLADREQRVRDVNRRRLMRISILVALGVAVYLWLARSGKEPDPGADSSQSVSRQPAVPVSATQATQGDFNRYITALGTVTAFNTVTVKSRVDGQIDKVDFEEGQFVEKGQLLVEIDPRPFEVQLKQAEGQLARDQATLKESRVDLGRDQDLYTHGALARQQLDNQRTSVKQNEGSIVADQANVDNARLQLTYSRITAPISGRIGLRQVDSGNIVHATDAQGLAVITQLQPIAVLFSIPEDDLPKVMTKTQSGDTLLVDAYDRDLKNKLANGSLLTVDNQIDTSTGTVKLKAVFPNDDNRLFPNQFVNVKLLQDVEHDAVMIPAVAVQRSSLGNFVYVVKPGNTVAVRNVKPGATEGDTTRIKSGVNPGEMVVVDGLDKLQPGAKVIVSAAAKTAASTKGR